MRARLAAIPLTLGVVITLLSPVSAQAADCWFFCQPKTSTSTPDPANRTPGTPVEPVKAYSSNPDGGGNAIYGDVPKTAQIGVMNPGVVPVVGSVKAKADSGAYVLYESKLNDRFVDLMVYSPKVGGNVPVRLQLPASWKAGETKTYPALFLLHGGAEKADYQSWSLYTKEPQMTKDLDAFVVMPSGGASGQFTNYWNYGNSKSDQWQDWLSDELPQILQRGYRFNGKSSIAGMSAGARGSLEAAYQNPGQYGAAAAFSGLLDSQMPVIAQTMTYGSINYFEAPYKMWGSSLLTPWIWNEHNPTSNDSMVKLKNAGTKYYVSYGSNDYIEALVKLSTESFISKAKRYNLPLTTSYTWQWGHGWPAWEAELARSGPMLLAGMGL